MRIIDADTFVTIQVFDEMYEEYNLKTMTIAEALNLWTEEGCPSSVDTIQGEWHLISPARVYECSICNHNVLTDHIDTYKYCPNCGARMKGGVE